MFKLGLILGTRPDIIKMSPIIKEVIKRQLPHFIIHSGQHYSHSMDEVFFKDLNLPEPHFRLKKYPHSIDRPRKHIVKMQKEFEKIFSVNGLTDIITYGDTNTTLASAFAAKVLGLRLYHVEAGLRSGNIEMVEELNRILVDRVSDILFAPTEHCMTNLESEDSNIQKNYLSGNTISDVLYEEIKTIKHTTNPENFAILTLHRPELIDDKENFERVFSSILKVLKSNDIKIKFFTHPRVKEKKFINKFRDQKSFFIADSIGYKEFIKELISCKLVITDSGGLQEESCILKKPCITVRSDTERPESIQCGANSLCDPFEKNFEVNLNQLVLEKTNEKPNWVSPYGDGKSSIYILDTIEKYIKNKP